MSAVSQRLFPAAGCGHGPRLSPPAAPASHRPVNDAGQPLEVIEAPSGTHPDEDDIVRFDDVYGREDSP